MLGIGVAMLLGILVGLARRGSLSRLERVTLRRVPVVFAAVGLQLLGIIFEHAAGGSLALALTLLAFSGIAWFAAANARETGMPLIALGSLSNLLVVASNGGMPVSVNAMRAAGLSDPFVGRSGAVVKGAHHALTDASRLRFLADVIGLRYGAVVSVGDLLIWAGIILLTQHLMVGPRGRHLVA